MRIGIFTDAYPPMVNGINFVAITTKRELEALGHEVFIFAPGKGIRGMRKMEDGVYRFPSVRSKHILPAESLISIIYQPSETKRIVELELDIIHTLTPNIVGVLGLYVARKHNIPLVQQYCTDLVRYAYYYPRALPLTMTAALVLPFIAQVDRKEVASILASFKPEINPGAWSQNMSRRLMPIIYNQSDYVVAVSKKVEKNLLEYGVTVPMSVVPTGSNPLPSDHSQVAAVRASLGLKPSDKVVLSVGRLSVEKNLDLLIEMMPLLLQKEPHAKLVFVGDFDHREALEKQVAASGLQESILFAGKQPHAILGNYYAMGNVFAFPSLTDTQGLVINEAAGAGLPIVIIDNEVTEVVRDGVNGLVAENTAHSFADKTAEILANAEMQKAFGEAGKKIVAAFSERKQTEALVAIYESLL